MIPKTERGVPPSDRLIKLEHDPFRLRGTLEAIEDAKQDKPQRNVEEGRARQVEQFPGIRCLEKRVPQKIRRQILDDD